MAATKKDIEALVVAKMTGEAISKALSSEEFVKEIIRTVAERFTAEGPVELSLILPETMKKGLEPFVADELSKILGAGVEASFSKKVSGGFRIGPKDGGYFISLTDETSSLSSPNISDLLQRNFYSDNEQLRIYNGRSAGLHT